MRTRDGEVGVVTGETEFREDEKVGNLCKDAFLKQWSIGLSGCISCERQLTHIQLRMLSPFL